MSSRVFSLLYVSRAVHNLPDDDDPVAPIVEVALSRNPTLDVTGALIFTGSHFSQLLEGPRAGVEELMESIGRDLRHSGIRIVHTEDGLGRRFADWSLAYAGPSLFVERHIAPLVKEADADHRLAYRLISLMCEFTYERARSR